jgi:hypothetical protein
MTVFKAVARMERSEIRGQSILQSRILLRSIRATRDDDCPAMTDKDSFNQFSELRMPPKS